MAEMDAMRHWGRRDYVDEVSDSDSDFGNGPLFTIQEGDDEDWQEDQLMEEEGAEDVCDAEYGNENETGNEEDEDLQDDKVKTLYGDSDTETTVHDSTANSTATMTNMHNQSLLQVSQPSHRIGSHNYIPASATGSSANGKYRTVSVFGGILDLADPTDDSDGDSFSSDGFSDDWSVEEEAPKRRPRKVNSRQAPTERIEFKSEQARDVSGVSPKLETQDEQIEKSSEAPSEILEDNEENEHQCNGEEQAPEPVVKESLESKVTSSLMQATTTDVKKESAENIVALGEDAAAESAEINVTRVPKSIDLSLFTGKPMKEQQRLLTCFLNELAFCF
ncbi:MAG: hypothetical protein SGBAC_004283 [Bacillariaceae sp.]